jgi:hypothetical protein
MKSSPNNNNKNNIIPPVIVSPSVYNTPISVVSPYKNTNIIDKNHPIYK